MAGKPGRSGRRMKTLANHVLTGTYRPDRHGLLPADLIPAPPPTGAIPLSILAGLTGRGRAFVKAYWRAVGGWTPATLVLLREAGMLVDALETARGTPPERQIQRLLVKLLGALPQPAPAAVAPAQTSSRWTA
jgi:hypothetical protein